MYVALMRIAAVKFFGTGTSISVAANGIDVTVNAVHIHARVFRFRIRAWNARSVLKNLFRARIFPGDWRWRATAPLFERVHQEIGNHVFR